MIKNINQFHKLDDKDCYVFLMFQDDYIRYKENATVYTQEDYNRFIRTYGSNFKLGLVYG